MYEKTSGVHMISATSTPSQVSNFDDGAVLKIYDQLKSAVAAGELKLRMVFYFM